MEQTKVYKNPYVGIRSFEINKSHLFFGREKETNKILALLAETHFLAVIGSSGSGKSSLIKAGVIPQILKDGLKSVTDWTVTVIKPGDKPFNSFVKGYTKTYNKKAAQKCKKAITTDDALKILQTGEKPIFNAYKKLTDDYWLIVVDQFEDVFRYESDHIANKTEQETKKFINLFLDVLNYSDRNVPIYIIFTIRSEFIDNCAELPGLIDAITTGNYFIPKMELNSLYDVIVNPLMETGQVISTDLVEKIIDDVEVCDEQLPILQHTLMRVWDYWNKQSIPEQPIDVIHYQKVGTVYHALSQHADEVYNSLGSDEKRKIAEKMFKTLVEVSGTNSFVSRTASFNEILNSTGAKENELIDVIDHFRAPGRAFLTPRHPIPTYDETIIDISHESIMRLWKKLRHWIDEETKSAELYLRLSKSAELFQQGITTLWKNPELAIAINWMRNYNPNTYWADRYNRGFERAIEFLEYSKQESDFELKNKEKKQKEEIKRAQRMVITLSIASVISIILLVVSLILTYQAEASEKNAIKSSILAKEENIKAEKQRKDAEVQKRIAEQQQEIAEQQKLITEEQKKLAHYQRQLALLREEQAKESEQKAKESEKNALQKEKEATKAKEEALNNERKAEISRVRAEISEANAKRLMLLSVARSIAIESQNISGDNPELSALLASQAFKFTKDNNGNINDPDIFNSLSNSIEQLEPLRGHKNSIRAIKISNDGLKVFSAADDGKIFIWDTKSGEKIGRLTTRENSQIMLRAIDTWDNKIIAGTNKGEIFFWPKGESSPIVFESQSKDLKGVMFINEFQFVSISTDGSIKTWNIKNQSTAYNIYETSTSITDISLSGDKKTFICSGTNGNLWVFLSGYPEEEPVKLSTNLEKITAVTLNFSGNKIAVGQRNGLITIIEKEDSLLPKVILRGHQSAITALQFSNNGNLLASSSYDNTINIWNPGNPKLNPIVISKHDSWVMDIAFDKTENKIISGSNDKTLMIHLINPTQISGIICKNIDRNLTKSEWKKYIGTNIKYQETCP